MSRNRADFIRGIQSGIPVFIGYFTASIAFGLLAVTAGLRVWEAVVFSMVSVTGAGQFMSVNMIMLGVSPVEAVFSVFLLNFRYMLMSMSLSLKIDFPRSIDRFLAAYWVTDENFSLISAQEGKVPISYVYGVELIAYAGWTGGTLVGALGGSVLPRSFQEAAGIALYALFVTLLVPEVRKSTHNLLIALLAGGLNTLFVIRFHWPAGWSFVAAMLTASFAGSLKPGPRVREAGI
jgi:4-azaleucine resistance transporter AzlC